VCSIATIVVIAIIIYFIHDATPAYAAIAIAVANMLFPTIAKLLTDIERHSSEGLKQTSLYFKIAVFRWVNTAIVSITERLTAVFCPSTKANMISLCR
jgi:predicted signal transduction protein with EAL and GGDEF domain